MSRAPIYGALAILVIVVASLLAYYQLAPGGTSRVTSITSHTSSTGTCLPGNLGTDWTTYHGDNSRSGSGGPNQVSCANEGWQSPLLDGRVYAEPLAFGGKIIVATENNSVYALNSLNGDILWRTHLGEPIPGNSLPCGNIDPSGITGTPVIDP